jgi:hypothetical protein
VSKLNAQIAETKDAIISRNLSPACLPTEWRDMGGEPRFAEVPDLVGLRPRLLQQEPEVGALAARFCLCAAAAAGVWWARRPCAVCERFYFAAALGSIRGERR